MVISLSGLMCELLWSDPQPQLGRGPSKRGVGLSFGADVTKKFLEENNLGKPPSNIGFHILVNIIFIFLTLFWQILLFDPMKLRMRVMRSNMMGSL